MNSIFPEVLKKPEVKSLLKKYLTPELLEVLKNKRTSRKFTIWDVINNGIEQPKSSVGIYATDHESYQVFSALFHPVIEDFHVPYKLTDGHVSDTNPDHVKTTNLDPLGKYIRSTRIGLVRNFKGYGLAPALTREERVEVEEKVVKVLNSLTGDLAGTYYPLSGMDEATSRHLAQDNMSFERDSFLDGTGANRDWPVGRGIFHNKGKTLLVWIGEEEQLRITSMEKGDIFITIILLLFMFVNSLIFFLYKEVISHLSSTACVASPTSLKQDLVSSRPLLWVILRDVPQTLGRG